MTCIVGLVFNKNVYIGGDSAGVNSCFHKQIRADEKVFVKDGFIFGFTSSFRMGQLLHYSLKLPPVKADLMAYMVTDFVDAVRNCFKAGGYGTTLNGEDSGGFFLVGHKGRLFQIAGDYQVGEVFDRYAAVGCGQELALGSLYSSTGKPEQRIRKALQAAAHHSAGVAAPFIIKKV